MFGEFFRFELRYQLRSPLLWLVALVFGLLAFGATSSDGVQVGSAIGNVNRNAPTVIANLFGAFSLVGLFLIVLFIANGLLRDHEFGTAELFFATPMRKADYLFGRFAAGLLACMVIFVGVAIGMIVGQFMPWVDPKRLGPFSLDPFLWSFAVVVLPNLLFGGALLALLAAVTRSLLMIYVGVLAFFVLWIVAGNLTSELDNAWIAALIDPFGLRAMGRAVRYWSVEERNTQLPELAGYVIANRALWGTVALGMLAATYALFKPMRAGTGSGRKVRRKAAPASVAVAPAMLPPLLTTHPPRHFDLRTALAQFWRLLKFDTWGVLRSVPFLVMLIFGAVNFTGGAQFVDSLFGTRVYPVTYLMLSAWEDSMALFLFLIVTFYAGELVWKERQVKISDVSDALPVPNWVPLAAKCGAVLAVVAVFGAAGVLAGMGFQLLRGYTQFEPGVYAASIAIGSVPFVLMGLLGVAVQVFTHNKFLGYLVVILVYVSQLVLGLLDIDHNLVRFGGAPIAPYSDMNGFGHYLVGWAWFTVYWLLFVVALLLLAAAFWVRGTAPSGRERRRQAAVRLRGPLGAALGACVAAWAAVGGWVFWNTNVVNDYLPGDRVLDERARYEKEYAQYADLPQPRILAVDTDVDIRPETRSATIRGTYRLVNPHAVPIETFHVMTLSEVELLAIDFAPHELERFDEALGYRIYRLREPMAPGAEMTLRFELRGGDRGFGNSVLQTQVVGNGSFFNSRVLPSFGYDRNGQIVDRNERRKRDLGEVPRMAKLEDESARANTYISNDADWIDFRTKVCTAPDQIALAPGYLESETTENGRRCFVYAMDQPMLPFFAWLSARWEVKKDAWNGIPIEVYYHKTHPYNVDRMIEATQDSLDYFTANFTPYQHKQVRIIEFPRYARFAQSFANTIPFSESIGFIADLRDKDAIDYVYYVTSHEVAHQWWAHQVIGADVQGSTVLSESLSQYSALMVMEKKYGREQMRRFLKYELDRYLFDRGGELVEELPLYRVENQQYIHYRKGSLVFYRLREEMGEEALNRALKRYLQDKGFQQPPYTTSAELLDYIRAEAPAEAQALITDLFQKITFYDNRVVDASATRRDDGRWDVTLALRAGKLYSDGLGKETPAAIDDVIEVAVFARAPGAGESAERVLHLERRHITEDQPTITVTVDEEPYEAGIDPYNKLIDRVPSDNRKRVDIAAR
jgi:ABC-type transport system involved in multi-copper enzyme maturation permease subunit